MPAVTAKQRRFMGAELARKRKGQYTKTGMNTAQRKHDAAHPKNPPLFGGGSAIGEELEPLNTARWEEPLLGPEGQHPAGYTPGALINQASFFRNPGPDPSPRGKGDVAPRIDGEPRQQEAALVDADFHNQGRDDFRKRTDATWTGDVTKWSLPGSGA